MHLCRYHGKEVVQVVQEPGQVLYIPQGLPHAIHNLDNNIALTRNQLFSVGHITPSHYRTCIGPVHIWHHPFRGSLTPSTMIVGVWNQAL